jgi:uncharacterized protein YpmS
MNKVILNPLAEREAETLAQVGGFFTDTWNKIAIFFTSYQWKEVIFALKTTSIIISLILGILIVLLLIKINIKAKMKKSISRVKKTVSFNKRRIEKRWTKIENKLNSGVGANYKLAILEADKIFNDILKVIGYEAQIRITNMDEIKKAGKVKNNIIEDSQFSIDENDARLMVGAYRRGLEDLEVV